MTVFWDVAPCSIEITLMIEAVNTSETSVNFYQTTTAALLKTGNFSFCIGDLQDNAKLSLSTFMSPNLKTVTP
jgi:hypothetical protein